MGVKAPTYTELLKAYRNALETWSRAKAMHSPDGPELIAAAVRLEEIENELQQFGHRRAA